MSHAQSSVGRPADEGGYSECLPTVCYEEAERPIEKRHFGEKGAQESRGERKMKHQGNRDSSNGPRKQLKSCLWVGKRVQSRERGILLRNGLAESKDGARWEDVRLGGVRLGERMKFFAREEGSSRRLRAMSCLKEGEEIGEEDDWDVEDGD